MLKIPKTFLIDHQERDLPTPKIIKKSSTHFYINENDPNLPELLNDAKFYADPHGPDGTWIKSAAKALLRAIG